MGDSHHFHHHHHNPRPKSQVFCDDEDDDMTMEFPERSSSSAGIIRHSETHHSVQSQNQKSELEQLRSRVCQMEKTLRWWSDCTSNWKHKWSQVRQERNTLRAQLKDITGGNVVPKPEVKSEAVQTDSCDQPANATSMSTAADVHLLTKLLDEAQRTIGIEREEKLHLHRSIERLQQDLVEFHAMYDELVKEVQLLKLDDTTGGETKPRINNKTNDADHHTSL
ncbi:unnamed protein product [Orchesella dallaii]|uniref:Coiled-coil domain-containing protein 102A n=1 Tax=Orchesella dallaii TaxID=48710 RepID=A0ABP1S6B8_9HEXA